jgi:hypothetical protein
MVILATAVGLRQHSPRLSFWPFFKQLVWRGSLLIVMAIIAGFISTPYAMLKSDYWWAVKLIWYAVASSYITPINYLTWLSDFWNHFGPLLLTAAAVSAVWVLFESIRAPRWSMILFLVLGLSQLLWFSVNSRVWVELGYMLCLFAAVGAFVGELVAKVYRFVASPGGLLTRGVALAIAGLVVLSIIVGRWWGTAALALHYRLLESNTVVQIGRWAEAGNSIQTPKCWVAF